MVVVKKSGRSKSTSSDGVVGSGDGSGRVGLVIGVLVPVRVK